MPSTRTLRNAGFGIAAALPLSLAAGQAQAIPYAYASNVDSGFVITSAPPASYNIVAGGSTFTTTNTTNTTGLLPPFVSTVSNGPITSSSGSNALQAFNGTGPAPAEDTFTQALKTGNAVRSDSNDAGFLGNGANVAEGRLVGQPANGSATGAGSLNSTTLALTTAAATQLTISFSDTIGLEVATAALAGESAKAQITSSISIFDSTGAQVFSFTPDGTLNATTGGTTVSDPFNLNRTISSAFGNPLDTGLITNSGTFTATTNTLAAGNYTVTIGQISKVDLTAGQQTVVPEPASLALLGAGLLGLGAFRRSKKSA